MGRKKKIEFFVMVNNVEKKSANGYNDSDLYRRENMLLADFSFMEALGIVVQNIICMTIIDVLADVKWSHKVGIVKIIWLILNFLIWCYVVEKGDLWNILGVVLDIAGYCIYLILLRNQYISSTFTIVMVTQIINQVGALLVSGIVFGLDYLIKNDSLHQIFLLNGYMFRLVLLYLLHCIEKRYHIVKILEKVRMRFVIILVGILFQITGVVIRINHKSVDSIRLYIALTILIMGILFSILWVIDWYYNEREKKLLWEDNHRMSQRLHKSKEIIPALSVVLEELKSNKDSGEFNDILDEIHQLCKEQIDENEKLSIQNKTFPTTEIRVLDEQIQIYEIEAIEKDINFDVFVGTPMRQVLRGKRIKELDFLRIIGDLMRNAFRAIERTDGEGGNILLVMGCVGEVLQIDIYDSGAPFPMFILNEFGKRGNTEGGTGNGLSDTLELLEKYQATFLLTEYEDGAAYTKGISIIWDDKNERRLDSHRISMLSKDSPLFPKES